MDERPKGNVWQEHGKGMYSIEPPLLTDDDISNAARKWGVRIATRPVGPGQTSAEEEIVVETVGTRGEEALADSKQE